MTIPLAQQVEEVEIVAMAKSNNLSRAKSGEIKRPTPWIERQESAVAALWAAYETLRGLMEDRHART